MNDDVKSFLSNSKTALVELFEGAKRKNELQFAFSLNPEFRGLRDAGWNSAEECFVALNDYVKYLNSTEGASVESQRLRVRVALALYTHVAEASGFYEMPKNMLRVSEGKPYILWPFKDLVLSHKTTGEAIAPNANKVLQDLIGHCEVLQFHALAITLRDLFDADLRNGFAHADYVVWDDGIRLTKRNGGTPRIIPYLEFNHRMAKAIGFFHVLAEVRQTFLDGYNPPKTFRGKCGDAPETDCTASYVPGKGFHIQF